MVSSAASIDDRAAFAPATLETSILETAVPVTVAAAEVVIGLAIVVAVMRRRPKASVDEVSVLRG